MKKTLSRLQHIEDCIVVSAFVVMTLAAFAQVVNRNLIGWGISWFEEIARYCMIYMTLLGTEMGLRDGSQIAVTMVLERFQGASRQLLNIVCKAVVLLFSSVVFWTSFNLLEKQILSGQTSPGLGLPMYIPYAALPLSFGLITLVQGVAFVLMIAAFVRHISGGNKEVAA